MKIKQIVEGIESSQGVAEGNETTPFGSVNDQRPQMPDVPQQDREAQEQALERQARINDFREKKRDLLQQFAQLGTLRTEMIHGLDNNVFLNKDQLIDFFKQQIDDPSLTALEYAYENDIPTDGLIKNILRRATQLGISMLDVRKMFNQAKQKLGENIGHKVDAKGLTQGEWMQRVKQKFPDAKIIQAKMIDGPAHALLSDGRKIVWNPVQDVTEVGQNFRRGNARRAALNSMSPEELKAYEEKRAEQQRKRDEARLERDRQRTAAKKGVAEGQEVDVNVIVGKLYDMIDHAENQIKNADTDNQAKYATILRDRAQKALVMIKQGGHTSDTASAAYKYFLTGQQNKLEEVSLGDYRRKASLSKAGAQIDKVFGSPENREKADSIIAKRDRGLDRADARGRANAEKLKQKAEQDRIASLRSAKDRLDDIKAELAELEAKFDSYYEYSDDHGEWTRQRELHQKIMAMKKHIADIEALDEADDNFSQPATMTRNVPKKDLKK